MCIRDRLKANPDRLAKGTIIEAQLDKGRGPVATVLVETGTLRTGDTIIAGTAYGRVRAMVNDIGQNVSEALPSQPVEVIGFSEVPVAGDILHATPADKLSKQVAEERKDKQKAEKMCIRDSSCSGFYFDCKTASGDQASGARTGASDPDGGGPSNRRRRKRRLQATISAAVWRDGKHLYAKGVWFGSSAGRLGQ